MENKLLKEGKIEPRLYQTEIAENASKKNTLVVLPTGTGKTIISLLVIAKRLEKFPDSKILVLSPTRPLSAQHKKTFENFLNTEENKILLITGKIKPKEREELYKKAKIIVATPQTIANDLEKNRISLENFSFLVVDECHRSVKKYPYPLVAKKYIEQSRFPLILGLTASPGWTKERINEICKNLFIEAVEIRTEKDLDVSSYVQPIKTEWVYFDLPKEFIEIKNLLESILKENLFWLRDHFYISTLKPSKKLLIQLQERLAKKYKEEKNYSIFWAMMKVIESLKLEHALELLETQGIPQLLDYLKKIEKSKKFGDRRIRKDSRIIKAIRSAEQIAKTGIGHPKLKMLVKIIKEIINKDPNARMIVFANYRSTINIINNTLIENGINSEILVGQSIKNGMGLTQQKQIDVLKRFSESSFNVLCGTSISEEGLSIADVPYVIFYEPVPSEIRMIQRRGRTGRSSPGTVIFLITRGTRDEAYYWAALQKERRMKQLLYKMKDTGIKISKKSIRKEKTLLDWIK